MINAAGKRRDIAVIGASAGGVTALQQLFAALPSPPPGVVVAVIHRSPVFDSLLPEVLGVRNAQLIQEPTQDQQVENGRIYLAPRDRHLVFEDGRFRLHCGPKQHFTRPAIDPLFQTAAVFSGTRVVGVVLTGGGDDGVDGLLAIKGAGGICIAQDPDEAPHPWMPARAIRFDHIDAVLPLARMAGVLVSLANGEAIPDYRLKASPPESKKSTR